MKQQSIHFKKVCLVLTICLLAVFNSRCSSIHSVNSGRVLISNASLILTMDVQRGTGPLGIIENGSVLIDKDKIEGVSADSAEVERWKKQYGGNGLQIIDATDKIVMPGFVDVHNHLWQSLIRGCGVDKDLLGWLGKCVFPIHKVSISEEDIYAGVRLSTYDLINTGVTTVLDDSHRPTDAFVKGNIEALTQSGLRFIYAYCGKKGEASAAAIVDFKKKYIDNNPLA